jgi:hypothetical protein
MIGRVHRGAARGLRAPEARRRAQALHEAQLDVPAPVATGTKEVHIVGVELHHGLEVSRRAHRAPGKRPAKC